MRLCEACGEEYEPKRKDARWCSPPCRVAGHRADCRAYYHRDPEPIKANVKAYRDANKLEISAASKQRYARDRERILDQKRGYYVANVESIKSYRKANGDKLRASRQDYQRRNKDRIREVARLRRQQNARHRSAINRAWRLANREACRVIDQRKRNKKRADARVVTLKDWMRLLRRYNHTCAYCGQFSNLHMEHVVPLSRGGRHAIGNILPACASCNGSKATKFLIEWRSQQRRAA